jgi:hypothetical protein
MKHFLLVLLFAALICIPASAQTVSYTAASGEAVWAINIDAPPGSMGTFVLTQSNGDITYGTWSYTIGLTGFTAHTQIGSDSDTFGSVVPANLKMQIWNGDNVTYARQLKMGAGQIAGVWNTVIQTTIEGSPVVSYSVTGDQTIKVTNEVIAYEEADKKLNAGVPTDAFNQLFGYLILLWGVFDSLWYWLDLLFIQNLTLTVSLYVAGTMAYALNTSRNIFVFYKTWFKQQRALFEFMAGGFSTVISIVAQVLQSIKLI